MFENVFNSIFNRDLINEEKKYGNDYNISHILSKDFLKMFSDENIRVQIYAIYQYYGKEELNNFIEIYKINPNLAILSLNKSIVINNNIKKNIEENLEKINKIIELGLDEHITEYNLSNLDGINNIINIYNKRGNESLNILKNDYLIAKKLFNNDLLDSYDIDFVLNNKDEILQIMDFNVSLKAKESLVNVLKVNPEIFESVKQDILWNIDEEFLEFFNSIEWNKDVYYYLKHNDYFSKKFSYTSVGNGIYNILKNNQTIGNTILDYCLEKENDVLNYKRYINYKYTYNNEIENEKIIKEYYNLVTDQNIKDYLDFIKTINTLETIEEINLYLQQSNIKTNGEKY